MLNIHFNRAAKMVMEQLSDSDQKTVLSSIEALKRGQAYSVKIITPQRTERAPYSVLRVSDDLRIIFEIQPETLTILDIILNRQLEFFKNSA